MENKKKSLGKWREISVVCFLSCGVKWYNLYSYNKEIEVVHIKTSSFCLFNSVMSSAQKRRKTIKNSLNNYFNKTAQRKKNVPSSTVCINKFSHAFPYFIGVMLLRAYARTSQDRTFCIGTILPDVDPLSFNPLFFPSSRMKMCMQYNIYSPLRTLNCIYENETTQPLFFL